MTTMISLFDPTRPAQSITLALPAGALTLQVQEASTHLQGWEMRFVARDPAGCEYLVVSADDPLELRLVHLQCLVREDTALADVRLLDLGSSVQLITPENSDQH